MIREENLRWSQERSFFWAVIIIFVLLTVGTYYLLEIRPNKLTYKEIPCYTLDDLGNGKIVGLNESDYSKIHILEKDTSELKVIYEMNENYTKEIPLCEILN